jgi:hypothetical protein
LNWDLITLLVNYCRVGDSVRLQFNLRDNSSANLGTSRTALTEIRRTVTRCPGNRQDQRSKIIGASQMDYGFIAGSPWDRKVNLAMRMRGAGRLGYGSSNVPMWFDNAICYQGTPDLSRINHFRRGQTGIMTTQLSTVVAGMNVCALDGSVRWYTAVEASNKQARETCRNTNVLWSGGGGSGFIPTTSVQVLQQPSYAPYPGALTFPENIRWNGNSFGWFTLAESF